MFNSYIDVVSVKNLADKTGFQSDNLEKLLRLIDILKDINTNSFLKTRLVLKGGTAINILFFDMPRLSIDIDMNYIGNIDKNVMLVERGQIEKLLKAIFNRYKYDIIIRNEYAQTTYELSYMNILGLKTHIKFEINYLLRVPIYHCTEFQNKVIFNKELDPITSLAFEEIYGSKIIALLIRKTPRDLYDVYKIKEKNDEERITLIRKATIFYGCIQRQDFRELKIDDVDQININHINNELLPMLREDERSRINVSEMKTETKQFIREIFNFSKSEKQFISYFYKGEYRPEYLMENLTHFNKIEYHPAVAWRITKIQEEMMRREVPSWSFIIERISNNNLIRRLDMERTGYYLKLKIGSSEIEVAGDKDFVEEKYKEFKEQILDKGRTLPSTTPGEKQEIIETPTSEISEDFVSFYHRIEPKDGFDTVLVAVYYMQQKEGREPVTTREIAKFLKGHGIRLSNTSTYVKQLASIKKGDLISAGKVGKVSSYKLSLAGKKKIEEKLLG
jgi:hypothetical protein